MTDEKEMFGCLHEQADCSTFAAPQLKRLCHRQLPALFIPSTSSNY